MSMKDIRVEKVTLNMSTGAPGPELEKAKGLLEMISGKKVVKTKSKKRNTFGVARGREIGVMTTLRGTDATELLGRLLKSLETGLKKSCFDSKGNFSFGIEEYINIPGINYDPDIGIMGFDVAVSLERPGYRVTRRKTDRQKLGDGQRIKPDEAAGWVQKEFGVKVS